MSEPIKVGDLVYVNHTHCPHYTEGSVGTVLGIELPRTGYCPVCSKVFTACAALLEGGGWHPIQWLKRIPPLSELESEKREEEIAA